MHEWRVRTSLASRFKHIESSNGVYIKIIEGTLCRQIVAGLRGGMNNGGGFELFEQLNNA